MATDLLSLKRADIALKDDDFYLERQYNSGESCASCGDMLSIGQEIFVLQIMQCQLTNGVLECYDVLNDDGDFLYQPAFLEYGCMEQLYDELEELIEHIPPVEDRDAAVIQCNRCRSGIRAWEYFCRISFGEIRVSKRQPVQDVVTTHFEDLGTPDALCLSCLRRITTESLDLWPNQSVTQDGACEEGVHARCWRWGSCPCPHKGQQGY